MNFSKILYQDKVAPNVPEWYAEMKYDEGKDAREIYIENALNPYTQAYAFYNLRDAMKRKQLEEAASLEKQHAKKVKGKQKSLAEARWRNKVKYLF